MTEKSNGVDNRRIWVDRPSEIALYTYNYLKQSKKFQNSREIYVLDMGCGNGRDARFLAKELPCHILGIDTSEEAVTAAQANLEKELSKHIEFLCYDFKKTHDKFDIILASNLYHLLPSHDRIEFRKTVKRCLKTDGMLFLSTLSARDPQHSTKGTPVQGEVNSIIDERYLHLTTREEIGSDFEFLNISALFEWEYDEPKLNGMHHHISWLMVATHK